MHGRAMDLSPDALARDAATSRRREYESLATSVMWRIAEGSLTPDDAYAWTRIVVWQARQLDLVLPLTLPCA